MLHTVSGRYKIASLIAYIPKLLPLPMFTPQRDYGGKSVCNMCSSIFSSFYFRQMLPRKKLKMRGERFEKSRPVPIFFSSDYAIIYLLIIQNWLHYQNKYSKTRLQVTEARIYAEGKGEKTQAQGSFSISGRQTGQAAVAENDRWGENADNCN